MTFLETGGHTYVRASTPDLRDFFAEPYDPARPLPADAVDTGFELDGRHLVHNYGHSGAGVSLSWGCADRVLEIVRELVKD